MKRAIDRLHARSKAKTTAELLRQVKPSVARRLRKKLDRPIVARRSALTGGNAAGFSGFAHGH